jgi:hypothetical protein
MVNSLFAAEGLGVEEGYWEKHKHDMAVVVYSFFLPWT